MFNVARLSVVIIVSQSAKRQLKFSHIAKTYCLQKEESAYEDASAVVVTEA